MRLEQRVADGRAQLGDVVVEREAQPLEQHLARQRVAVRVQARSKAGRAAHRPRARLAGERATALDHADDEARQVVVVGGVRPGHLRRLAADQRASELAAGACDAADDRLDASSIHPAERNVVEEEERQRTLDEDVVDAMRHQVVADRVVHAGGQRDADLRSDAVGRRDQDGLLVAPRGRAGTFPRRSRSR